MKVSSNTLSNWQALGPGDAVDMIAAGFPFDWSDVKASKKILNAWGLEIDYPKNILSKKHPVSANSREERIKNFKNAVLSKNKIIWAARGGYGSLHLVSHLKKIKPPKQKKLLIGFSDNCTLQHFVSQEWGWPVIHGPHIDRLSFLNQTRLIEIRKILFGEKTEIVFKNLKAMNQACHKRGTITATVTGGNLVTAQSTLGTPWQMEAQGKILFFEEIGERGYRVDRILEHLTLMGIFQKARAVIFGPFVGGDEPSGKNKVKLVLKDFALKQKIPVYQGLYSGHVPNSLSLPMNTRASLSLGTGGELTVSTGCLS